MSKDTLGTLLLPEEAAALEVLSDGLIADINARLRRIKRVLGVKRALELFEVTVIGIQLTVEIDDETREYLLDRRGRDDDDSSGDEDIPNYYA
jgi:hypothetical protein